MAQARNELENLGAQSGEAKLRFASAAEALKRLEARLRRCAKLCRPVAPRKMRCAREPINCVANLPLPPDAATHCNR